MARPCSPEGRFEDLEKLGIDPAEGVRLAFYDCDADGDNNPTYICADGVLHFIPETKTWCAFVDEGTFRTVPRITATE